MAEVIPFDPEMDEEEAHRREIPNRDRDLLGRRAPEGTKAKGGIRRRLDDLFTEVMQGFRDQSERSDLIEDYWDCYNCQPNHNRYYQGIADIYLPMIHDAVEARVTRFANQMFPQGGRYVQAIDSDGDDQRDALVAVADHYVRQSQFKTQIACPLIRNGDVEGQYNLYVDWGEAERQIVSRETRTPRDPVTGVAVPGEPFDDISEEDVIEGFPIFEVLHDNDVLVTPETADSVTEALQAGGSATIVRRWSRAKLKAMARAGNIRQDEADDIEEQLSRPPEESAVEERLLESVGVNRKKGEITVWETWVMLPLNEQGNYAESGRKRLCRVFFGPDRAVLGAKRNPYWSDRCPLLSWPLQKMSGVFKGPSLIRYVASLQYEANDAVNEGADAATLSAGPIVARDPDKSSGPLVFNIGAVWDIPPDSVELLQFPDLTPRAQIRVQMAMAQIFQTLGVNPSMLPQNRISQPNQAQIAQEQAVDLLTTAMAVSILEEGILTPAIEWMVDLDYQFRDEDLIVRMYGETGKLAVMEQVGPLQNRKHTTFLWRGGEQVRQNAMFQQQGAQLLGVLMNPALVPLLAAQGIKLSLAPVISQMVTNAFGPEIGGAVLVDQREQLSIPQDEENMWLQAGDDVPVHPLDNDEEHLRKTQQAIQETGDPTGMLRVHAQKHMQQRAAKIQAVMQQQMMMAQQSMAGPQGQLGPPGAGGPPGSRPPQPGAMPGTPHAPKQAPGAIPPEQMMRAGGVGMPRKF